MSFSMSFFRNFAALSFVLTAPGLAFPSSSSSGAAENGQAAAALSIPEVNTTSGVVVGNPAPKFPQVGRYLGIPFGQSTEGEGRWMPPKRYSGTGRIAKTTFGAGCPGSAAFTGQSEDCLFINVFTPPNINAGSKKPVMLWIYGGAFAIGDGGMFAFDPVTFVNNQDLIVVTFNYRVNLFGFPGAPGLEHLNPGLLDQRLATEWVRDNIAGFGGDPKLITLFGESAGGSSVDFYSYVYQNDPIVAGLIAQSGAATGNGVNQGVGLIHKVNGHKSWYTMSKRLGCGGEEAGAASLACAKKKTLSQVASAGGGGFGPWVDDKTVFTDVMERARDGKFMKVPLFIGTNNNESRLFNSFGMRSGSGSNVLSQEFQCGAANGAAARAAYKVPTWRYIFANNKPGVIDGATHGDEVFILFGEGKDGLSKYFQQVWAAFARDPVKGLSAMGFPQYQPGAKSLVRIAPDGKVGSDFVEPEVYDGYLCPKLKFGPQRRAAN